MKWTQEKIDEIYLRARDLAARDTEFRAELLKDPVVAIEALLGEALPKNYSIKLVESDPNYTATFVLPPLSSGEISDDALDGVAGGVHGGSCGAQVMKP